VFRFRASTDEPSLRFVGKTVIDTWGCLKSTATGHLSRAGKAAVITFYMTFRSAGSPCVTQSATSSSRRGEVIAREGRAEARTGAGLRDRLGDAGGRT